MNFKRIQWIFIIAFVLLDVGLCISLLMGNQFHSSGKQQSQTQITLKEMKSDMISFDSLSNKRRSGYYTSARHTNDWTTNNRVNSLKGQTARWNSGTINSSFEKPIKLKSGVSIKHQLDPLIHSSRIIHGKEYQYNAELSSPKRIVYTQTINSQTVLDNDALLKLHVNSNHEITGYSQSYLSDFKTLRPRAMTVSQQQAVTWLYRHNQIANNSQIRNVIFGYSKIQDNDNQAVYVPVWYVTVKNKGGDNVQHLRVNAFSGAQFKTNGDN